MANYQYVIPSTFRPFSMDEMLKPYLMYAQVYEGMEDQYSQLQDKADKFKYLSDTLPKGSKARQLYEGFANELNSQANSLLNEGISMNNRRALRALRGRYAGEIGRIEQADTVKRLQEEEQRKAKLQSPSMLFDRDAAATSIDEYLNNPHLNYSSYSGDLLAQQTGQAASALARSLREYGMGKPLDDYTSTFLQKRGMTPEQVLAAINKPQDSGSDKVLTGIVENVMKSSGIKGWNDPNVVKQAYEYANRGLWQAIGQDQVAQYENFKARLDEQEAKERRMMETEAGQTPQINDIAIDPEPLYNSREKSKKEKEFLSIKNKYSKYFYTDSRGQVRMNAAGWKEYNAEGGTTAQEIMTTPEGTTVLVGVKRAPKSDFRLFMDSIGAYNKTKGTWKPGTLGNVWNHYLAHNPAAEMSKYDATKATEYGYDIDESQQDSFKNKVLKAARGVELTEVDYDPKSKKFEPTGNTLSLEDLNSKDYTTIGTPFSIYGNTVFIKDKEGKVKRYRLPSGINLRNEQNRDKALAQAEAFLKEANNPKRSKDKREYSQRQYKIALQEAYMYHSQLLGTNTTEKQNFKPYGNL